MRLGLTCEDLAYLSDLDEDLLRAVEAGDGGGLDLAGLLRLAWALGVDGADLLGRPVSDLQPRRDGSVEDGDGGA